MGVHDMEVCANGHPPIAHTEGYKNCPLCKAMSDSETENIIDNLNADIIQLEDEKEELENELESARETIRQLREEMKKHDLDEK